MIVIKKSGMREDFLPDKLRQSMRYANQRTEETIDIDALMEEFEEIIAEKETITTRQIDVIICGLLYSKGLIQTLVSYVSYDEKDKA